MDQSLLVFILSVLVFVAGALFINYTVKREEAANKSSKKQAVSTSANDSMKKAA